jgi:alpha-methylacyl-CoA racemase
MTIEGEAGRSALQGGPLAGVRIIEFEAIGPVPLAAMILADLGAEVVRIDRPQAGYWGATGDAILMRGRTRIALDLKDPAQRDSLLELVAGAGALIEGTRPGVMERLGLGPAECLGRNPALIYARLTGWGQEGPMAQCAGHDITYLAMTGALHAIGVPFQPPPVPLNLIGDYAGGTMFAALGIVSGVLRARMDGTGQVIDIAMVDGVVTLLSLYHELLAAGLWVDRRGSNFLDGAAPYYRCYGCADGGYVAVGALEPQFFAQLLAGLNIPGDRYNQLDKESWPQMERDFSVTFASAPRSVWEKQFHGTDACVAPVLSLSEASVHPSNVARSVFVAPGGIAQAAPAPRFSATPGAIRAAEQGSLNDLVTIWTQRKI